MYIYQWIWILHGVRGNAPCSYIHHHWICNFSIPILYVFMDVFSKNKKKVNKKKQLGLMEPHLCKIECLI